MGRSSESAKFTFNEGFVVKNLDKPLPEGTFHTIFTDEIGNYHGLKIERYTGQLREKMGLTALTADGRYKQYLEWCKLANSPLYKALG